MHMLTHGIRFSHRSNYPIAEVIGMRARETQALHSIDSPNRAQQVGEVVRSIRVRIHGLSKQHDFRHSVSHNLTCLANNFVEIAAALGSARSRDDAIRAAIIASALNGNPCLHLVESPWLEILVVFFEIKISCSRANTATCTLDK